MPGSTGAGQGAQGKGELSASARALVPLSFSLQPGWDKGILNPPRMGFGGLTQPNPTQPCTLGRWQPKPQCCANPSLGQKPSHPSMTPGREASLGHQLLQLGPVIPGTGICIGQCACCAEGKSSWQGRWEQAGRCSPAPWDAVGSSEGCRLLGILEAMPDLTVSLSCYSHF